MKRRILIVDDDAGMCAMLEARLSTRGYEVVTHTSPDAAMQAFAEQSFDAVVTDINMKGMSGLDLCRRLLDMRSTIPVVLITAFGSMDAAIAAIRTGAYDFIPKPFEIEQLVLSLERGIDFAELHQELQRLKRAVAASERFDQLVGSSPAMTRLYGLLAKVAQSDAPVLVTGESGTGKELVARAIHNRGPRGKGPLVAINCAAMPAHLLESELFGHVKGAFTDARAAKVGLFESARGGTIFLDEVGELPLGLQPKLLRALQERAIRPVGGTKEVEFDARVIAATNRDLETMVEEHRFREDLFFRINVIQVDLPPLRSRCGDILILAQAFLTRIAARANKVVAGFSDEAAAKLVGYSWPGNVRELQNCIERAVALASFDRIEVDDLPDKVRAFKSNQVILGADDPAELVSLEQLENMYVRRVVDSVAGNKSAAARILKIERKTLHRMLARSDEKKPPSKG
ncbi:MAG: sigma-54 dependent transcriptional regulator [Polyangiaceae bacterium]